MRDYTFIISMLLFLTGCANSPAVPMSKEDLYDITKGRTTEGKYVKVIGDGSPFQCRRATPEEKAIGREVILTGTSGPYEINAFWGNVFAARNVNNNNTIYFYNNLNACNYSGGSSSSIDVYLH